MISEKAIEKRLRIGIEKLGGICIKLKSPSMDGAPDRLAFLPGARFYLIEVKKPTGKLSAIQVVIHKLFLRLGFRVETLYTPEAVDEFLLKVNDQDLL